MTDISRRHFNQAIAALTMGGVFGAKWARAEDLKTIRFVYDWQTPDFELIPTAIAMEKGFYAAEGIKIDVIFPPDQQTTGRMLAVNQAEIAFQATTDIIFAADQGIPIKSIGMYSQSNNWGLFGRPGEPIELDKLKGKSIGVYADSWTKAMMPFVLKKANLTEDDVKQIIMQDSSPPLLLSKKLDLVVNTTNYGIPEIFEAAKAEPTVLTGDAIGVPDVPVWAYTASEAYLAEHKDMAKKWMAATIKGTEWAVEHPDEAVEIFTKAYPDTGSIDYNKLGWKLTVPLLKGPDGYMKQTDKQWLSIANALLGVQLIKSVKPAETYYTNELLG